MVRQTKKSFSHFRLSCDPVGCIGILSHDNRNNTVQSPVWDTFFPQILWLIVISYLEQRKGPMKNSQLTIIERD